ncbi:unnamed protein product [Porites lobata]|uniref:Uncharacterized protein n=1 Tax=Porites lobata TaxID=104759 RepID=A0ABN8PKM8_9CNID|nr:unnamed protein product [Porites lobata]
MQEVCSDVRIEPQLMPLDNNLMPMEMMHKTLGTFTASVMSTSGGVGIEADRHHKRIASLIAEKRRESYADVLNYIGTKLRFCLLRSVLIAIRGVRGKRLKKNTTSISSL